MDIKRSYYEDIELFKSKTILAWSLILLAVLLLLPWFIAKTHFLGMSVYLLNLIIIHCIVAIGLNILVGYTGPISLGHAGFFALGAFTPVLFVSKMGFPLFIALP